MSLPSGRWVLLLVQAGEQDLLARQDLIVALQHEVDAFADVDRHRDLRTIVQELELVALLWPVRSRGRSDAGAMGPCRLNTKDPYSRVGICGATIDTIVAPLASLLTSRKVLLAELLDVRSGRTIWRHPVDPSTHVASPVTDGDVVVLPVRTDGLEFVAVSLDTGGERWRMAAPEGLHVVGSTPAPGLVLAVTGDAVVAYRAD